MYKPYQINTYSVIVKGRVQGIGFRPFVYNQAVRLNLKGYVKNTKQGVLIVVQGKKSKQFIELLQKNPPHLAKITNLTITLSKSGRFNKFSILKSDKTNKNLTTVEIMPDLAICSDCIDDINNRKNRRYLYPFTNCTQCGPRYSIIIKPPYDRPRTTMKKFKMCPLCQNEYTDPTNRRFHAQPNACPACGPKLTLINVKTGITQNNNNKSIIKKTQELLTKGKIIAIKSIGGYQLVCDAKNNTAVKKLRARKHRPFKPMAIMCKNVKIAKSLCKINKNEENILKSVISPIVLLKKKKNSLISELIAPKNSCFGIMLPYSPLHKLLFTNVSRETFGKKPKDNNPQSKLDVLVMTSANPKGAPIICKAEEVKIKLGNVVDYILDNNRDIESRCDDSVVFYYKGPVIVRYSRGYVPEPIFLDKIELKPVLSFGSDLKNSFAIGKGNKVYLSPYIGDLISSDSIGFFSEMLSKYKNWFGIKPEVVVCDLHPDYVSSRLAEEYARINHCKLVKVQHHHAHLVSVMAENGLCEKVIGLGFDGTGYGTDKAVWGSEIMVLDGSEFNRLSHLQYLPLVGGDVATTNPRLIAQTYLSEIQNSKFKIANSNMVMTSSLARLFDAVASILGICHKQTFEAEAPIALETEALKARYRTIQSLKPKTQNLALFNPIAILQDVLLLKKEKVPIHDIALYFHQRIISDTVLLIRKIGKEKNIKTVCASGGVFQNRILLQGIEQGLHKIGFKFFINRKVSVNDGGIALGQAVIAGIL